MNRLALSASLLLAFGASSYACAQDMPQTSTDDPAPTSATTTDTAPMPTTPAPTDSTMPATPAPTSGPMPPADAEAAHSVHNTHVYHGAHRYPAKTRGGSGDPRIVDHSDDHLVVEPTSTTVTIQP
jgi:hypothetical protein